MTRAARNRGKKILAPEGTPAIAESLARAGWPVFPVSIYEDESGKRHKVPAVKWKAEATTSVETVRAWWAGEHRGRWIGVYAGAAGIVVLDLDLAKKGKRSGAKSLDRAGLVIPPTLTYPTPSGGVHHVYRAPEGSDLTIAQDLVVDGVKLDGVDVRSGAGLMVYYGPAIEKMPELAPAPPWLLVARGEAQRVHADRDVSATEDVFRERLPAGKPPKALRKKIRAIDFPAGAAHAPMLEAVALLIGEGAKGAPVGDLLDETRERYVEGGPDRGRDWDNAIAGSVRRFGLPLVSFALTEADRATIEKRNAPEAIEERKIEKKARLIAAHIDSGDDLSDDALAEHAAERLADTWLATPGLGLLRYDGRTWRVKDRAVLVDDVRILMREIRALVTAYAIRRGDAKLEVAAKTLGQRARISAVADLAAGIMLSRDVVLDADPNVLNVLNGVVDLRTGKLRARRADDYFTRCAPVEYDPSADATQWRRALEALPPKVVDWLQVRFGQALTGFRPDDDRLIILKGGGSNGKSTILEALRQTVGEESDGGYSLTVSDQLLLADPNAHPTTLMSLKGIRLAVFEELPEGRSLNVKRLKDVVGTPKIRARLMRENEVTFRTTHALFGSTNYLPIVAETDHGTWRRLSLVEFRMSFVETKAEIVSPNHRLGDPSLRELFEAGPSAAVLAWLVEGARRWYAAGRQMKRAAPIPKIVTRDTRAWRMDADPVMGYVAERLRRDDQSAVTTVDLAADFNAWLEHRGHKPWSLQTINSRFGGHTDFEGIERKRVRFGLTMKPSRPAAAAFGLRPIPPSTQAWVGVRFAVEADAETDAAFEDLADRISG